MSAAGCPICEAVRKVFYGHRPGHHVREFVCPECRNEIPVALRPDGEDGHKAD
jgi:hypothetical protein